MVAACKQDGWNINIVSQPAQSPDFNVLDLGLFSVLQSLQQSKRMTSVPSIITAVKEAFNELKRETLDNTFLTLMSVMEQCLANEGGNQYSTPHLKKAVRRRNDEDLRSLPCSTIAYQTGWVARYLK